MSSLVQDILFHSTAQGTDHHLLMVLAAYNEQYGTQTYPSIETLAAHIHKTSRYTFTRLKDLEANGHLKIERVKAQGRRPRNYYTVLRPWVMPDAQSTEQMITDIGAPLELKEEEKIKTSKITVIKCSVPAPEVQTYPHSKAAARIQSWICNPDLTALCLDKTAYAVA